MPPKEKVIRRSVPIPPDQGLLRAEAEAQLDAMHSVVVPVRSDGELLHELQVHQIELQMQNETLRQALHDLEESRDRWINFYDFSPIGYLTLSREGLIADINLTGATMLGEERGKLVNRRFASFVYPADRDFWYRHFVVVLKQDSKQNCELELMRGDGSLLHVQLDSLRLTKDNNTFEARVVLTDITHRVKIEESLRISSEELMDIHNHAPCGYHSLDQEGLVRRMNDTELAWLGYTREEVIGKKKWLDLVTSAGQQTFRENFPQFIKRGFVHDLEFDMIRKDGTTLTGLVNATAVYDRDGDYVLSRSTVFDITERKKAEDLLRFHSEILKNVSEGVFLIRASDGVIVYTNPRFEQLFGYDPDELIGKHVSILNAPAEMSPEARAEAINNEVAENGGWRGELCNIRKDGKIFWCHVSVSTYDHPEFGKVLVSVHDDITNRKRLEDSLRESEQRRHMLEQQEIVQTSLDGFWVINAMNGQILEVNDNFCRMTGYSREELLSMGIQSLDAIETPEETAARIKKVLEVGYDRFETRLRHKQGHLLDCDVSVTHSEFDGSRNLAFFRDITERKQAEKLKQTILNSVSSEIAVLDRNGVILAINQPWRRFTKENCAESGKPVPGTEIGDNYLTACESSLLPVKDGSPGAIQGVHAVLEGRLKYFSFEYPCHSPYQQRWFTMTVTPLGETENDGVVITHTDITERKRAEESIRHSLDQLKTFIQQAPISVAMFDRNMNYLAVSGRWTEEYGRGHADLVGLNHYEVHPDMPDDWVAVHQQALAGASLENKEDVWIQSDGTKRWLRWAVLPWVDENNNIGGIIISTEDINDTKELEMAKLERRSEMEHLQKMYVASQTASAVAHEMNQPLLAIASYNQAALMMIKGKNPDYDEICEAIEKSEQQALRAGQSIRDLINFLNRKEFPAEDFDLNKEIADIMGAAKSEHNLAFHSVLKLEEGLPWVRANRTHVQKVLLNLLHNGIDAMQTAGVPLPVITVTVRTAKNNSYAQLTIQDNGPGIKKEDVHRLFEPFFTTKSKGIGMGLAISRSLIEENGGQLWVDPQEGPGAIFHLTLPLAI